MGIIDHLIDDRCQCCGGVGPTSAVYVAQADETMELCDQCQPVEDSRL